MELIDAAREVLSPLGYEVLELSVSGSKRKTRLLLRIDRLDEQVVGVEDVTLASEVFGLELDRLDPFAMPYSLEVESPGPERPLQRARHFERFKGLASKVRAGGESFKGVIVDVSPEHVTFEVAGERRTLYLTEIEEARLAEWPDKPR
jgi:ribosome maturation factor RimP